MDFLRILPSVGRNEISKWTRLAAQQIGLDTTKIKITNHSNRSTAVSCLAKAGVGEHQITKITGHQNTSSIKSYLQLGTDHHTTLVNRLRNNELEEASTKENENQPIINYNSCTFNCNNCHFSK